MTSINIQNSKNKLKGDTKMKKLIKRIFRGKYYKNGESYVDTIVKVIICVVVGALLLTGVYSVAKSGIESAKNKVNDFLDYNSDGEDGPGGGDEPEPEEPMKPYLTFQSLNPFTISVNSPKWDGTMEYSTDTYNWATWDGSEIWSVGDKVYLRGTGNTRVSAQSFDDYSEFVINGTNVECIGNIETLLDWNTVLNGEHPEMNEFCFAYAFYYNSALITAPALPATTLAEGCYYEMFSGCTALTTAPELPATTLAEGCYGAMFSDCTSLTTAPELPATTLAIFCYGAMFSGCTSLTTVPALPATTLADYCYYYMFYGCTSLKISSSQTETYQYIWRIPVSGGATAAMGWNDNMLTETGGTFTNNPLIGKIYYVEYPPVGNVVFDNTEIEYPYLMFQSLNPFTIRVASPKWDGTMEYSTDTENWTTWDGSEIWSVDGKLYLRGTENTRVSANSSGQYTRFIITGTAVECVGNIETLLDWQTVLNGEHPTMADYCYKSMFYDCTALTTAPALPATTLADDCYRYMFSGCTALTTAPALPATTLAKGCYYSMFEGCTSLTTAPALPATTLADLCYHSMFYNCTALTIAPEFTKTTSAYWCYDGMFYNCTSLIDTSGLPEECFEAVE
jgi:hypothetical protein